jgi:hypothetical protein
MLPIPQQPALAARTASIRRAFQRSLGRRPTTLEAYHLNHAASLTARSELAAADPDVSHEEAARISCAAARARADLVKVIEARHREAPAAAAVTPKASSAMVDIASILGGGP